jgi:hypothetical protein
MASLHSHLTQFFSQLRSQSWLWLPFILFSSLPALASGRSGEVPSLLFLGGGALVISLVRLKHTVFYKMLVAVVCLVVLLGIIGQLLAPYIWLSSERHSFFSFITALQEDQLERTASRSWQPPNDVSQVRFSFEARLLSGSLGWQWLGSSRGYKLESVTEQDITFTRVTTPPGGDPYLMRSYDLGEPVGGHRFRVDISLRSATPINAEGCRGVWLQVWHEGGDASCLSVALTPAWQQFSHLWTAPEAATSPVIRIILNDFDGLSYDIKETKLYLWKDGNWQELTPLLLAAPSFTTSWSNAESEGGQGFRVTDGWQTYTFDIIKKIPSQKLTVTMSVPDGATLATRNVKFDVPSSVAGSAVIRQSYFFGHPNLAGHVVTLLTLIAVTLSHSFRQQLFITLLGFVDCFFTGSRTAWLVLLAGVSVLLWLKQPQNRKWLLVFFGAAALGLAVSWPYLGRLQITSVTNPSSRQDIWLTSLKVARDHFWTGIGTSPERFAELWFRYNPSATEAVPHAHNILLEWLVNFGLFGGLAVLWLFAGFFRIAWQHHGSLGLVIVVAVLALNMADVSLFYAWMLVPLVLYLNSPLSMNKLSTPKQVDFSNPPST